MKINKDAKNLDKSETVSEIPRACCDELAAVEFLETSMERRASLPSLPIEQSVSDEGCQRSTQQTVSLALP